MTDSRIRGALRVIGGWTVVCTIFVSQNVARDLTRGQAVNWWAGAVLEALYWVPWVLLTPPLLMVARRWPLGRGVSRRGITAHVFAMIGIALVQVVTSDALLFVAAVVAKRPPGMRTDLMLLGFERSFAGLFITACWKYWVFMGVHYAFEYHRRFRERELAAARLEGELATAQLQALRMQLHPHFLFNTLHSVSMLNFVDVDAANRILVQLSDLLRLTLEKSGLQEVPLAQEIDFIDRYLAIERVRFDDRLVIRLEIADAALDAAVPNLILQPLVENAIRHGIAPFSRQACLTIRARTEGTRLVLEVEDDGPGLPVAWTLARDAGIGLAHVRDRLAHAYGAEHSFDLVRPSHGKGLLARVTIPAKTPVSRGPRMPNVAGDVKRAQPLVAVP